ncbi:DUF4179 domain-containing protein [Paenibacillus massiliensis]|uniref:DUF4179 domain-containing protein n=1 Tax=Paenibacillus massiliensis TaxID=225917 RepID=UPI000403964E|nr:DUF4179 domain-containing protein [Paenibacillus massiliensis]
MSPFTKKDEQVPQPDYDLMWAAIEKEAYKRQQSPNAFPMTRPQRAKLVPISLVFSCVLLIGIPAFAGVAINWDKIGGRSVTNALNNGVGQQYDLKASSSGVTMHLNGVVTDGEKMKMLVSLDTPDDLTSYIGFATENNTLTSQSSDKIKVTDSLFYDPDSKKLIGIYDAPDTLQDDTRGYRFEAQNLVLYAERKLPLQAQPQSGDTIQTGAAQYPTIQVESIRHTSSQTIIRYKVAAEPSDLGQGNPQLVVVMDGQEKNAIPTHMPSTGSDVYIEQVFDLSEAEWKRADLRFTFTEEARRIAGTWTFDFEADGKKASEAMYTRKLQNSPEFLAKTGLTLKELKVTPLNIQIHVEQEDSLRNGIVHYNTAQLVIGDRTIIGGLTLKGTSGSYQHVIEFESPEWYKDWSDVPMRLILKEAVIEKRDTSKNWVTLNTPTADKQSTKIDVDGIEIQFAYYTDGEELIVESSSHSPSFKRVSQTTLRIQGTEVVPEILPRGMVPAEIFIDHYKNVPLDEKIELNPGIYRYSDPSRDIELDL